MSTRTIFEFNHDYTHRIKDDPGAFLSALERYLNSGSRECAEQLERFGIRRAWVGHHSTERRVVTKHDDVRL